MPKSNHLKFLTISLIVLLSACSGLASPAKVDEVPATGVEPQAAPVETTEVEQAEPTLETAPPAAEKIEAEPSEANVTSSEVDAVEEEAVVVEEEQPEPVIEEAEIEAVENQAEASAESAAVDAADATDTSNTVDETTTENAAPVETVPEEVVEAEEASLVEEELTPPVKEIGPSPEQQALLAGLNVLGQPPELFNEVWLNSEPLKLADLHGKVVIIEFWTFG